MSKNFIGQKTILRRTNFDFTTFSVVVHKCRVIKTGQMLKCICIDVAQPS